MARQLGEHLRATLVQIYQQNAHFLRRYGRWSLVAWLAALVDGKILLAIAVSSLTYRFMLSERQIRWQQLTFLSEHLYSQLQQLGQNPLGASVLAFTGVYGLAAAWSELGGHWAATVLLGFGFVNVLLLARNSALEPSSSSQHPDQSPAPLADLPLADLLEAHWQNLTDKDALKRLLAVRYLLRWSLSHEAGAEAYLPGTALTMRSHLIDCFRVMLIQESEPLVRVALIDGLKALQPKPQLSAGQPPMQPLTSQLAQTVVRRSVEYMEP